MTFRTIGLTSVLALCAGSAFAEMNFNRIASFATYKNMAAGEDTKRETSAEIIAVTKDGMTLVYTDSPLEALGRIDITDPANPKPLGNIALGGEPTSVAVLGNTAFAGVNTSESYTAPSGYLGAFNLTTGKEIGRCELGGQPDSVAAKNGLIAVAIENERDEDLGDGRTGQMPAGMLLLVNGSDGALNCDSLKQVDMTGLAEVSPEDPEPEFVDINGLGETVVTLQENNHLAVVSKDGVILSHFSAGAVDLNNIDTLDERGSLDFDKSQTGRKREPDAVKWLDDDHFAIANEGDMDGGSRGWTIFHKNGTVVYESAESFEHAVVQIGHYPDKRSDAKGVEPESIETATFGGTPMVFVGAERASVVGVYDVTDPANPVLAQLLPSGIGPEGYVAIPERNLLVSANEVDLREEKGPGAHVMIFEYQDAPAAYPMLTSAGADELIGWGAISGMVAGDDGMIYAVNDSFYGYQPTIFKIDATSQPAKIVEAIRVTRGGRPAQKLDLEGITTDGKGGFWLASEGRTDRMVPHGLYHVNGKGEIKKEIAFPAELLAVEKRFGSEGVTRIGDTLWIAIQRSWKDDPKDHVKLVSYNTKTKEWGAVRYPTVAAEKGWVGLSEIVAHDGAFYILERDNQIGEAAKVKQITRVSLDGLTPGALGGELPVVKKEVIRDLIPDLLQLNGYVQDKVEGLAILNGQFVISTDNDGVDDHSGETLFFKVDM